MNLAPAPGLFNFRVGEREASRESCSLSDIGEGERGFRACCCSLGGERREYAFGVFVLLEGAERRGFFRTGWRRSVTFDGVVVSLFVSEEAIFDGRFSLDMLGIDQSEILFGVFAQISQALLQT